MDEQTLNALRTDRVVDITTTGRKTGQPRRIEIVLVALDNGFLLSGSPGRPRSWYANLRSHPEFTVHLKQRIKADLPARAGPVTEEGERRALFQRMADSDPQRRANMDMEQWVAKSPLVQVEFL